MRTNRKDKQIFLHIIDYCDQVKEAVDEIGSYKNLISTNFNKNALSMPLVQIGELVSNLTDEIKEQNSHIPWVQIKALRNVLVHTYGKIEWDKVWDTALNDIPEFKIQCIEIEQQLPQAQEKGMSR